ncbi:MAG: 3-dehydroquinate synthase II [Nitrosopumilus sp.]|nr:3-dehydroquinate synthase II [Nitrosopumilus sp.]MDA7942902.1 3-dehydroquinate synthase II [Nitrosopumilus sp.]MDA7998744.1 3-dehydroquinate synthase II [Nitrosopumilus sp.]
MSRQKELIVEPKVPRKRLAKFLESLSEAGVRTVYLDPSLAGGMDTMHESASATHRIGGRGRGAGGRFSISSNKDIDRMVDGSRGMGFVIIDARDWKIIPLENAIARLHKGRTRVIASAATPAEARKMFSVLDVGVDGVLLPASSVKQVREALAGMEQGSISMTKARITEVREAGDGERVCVDTASMLGRGEGMLVGSRSNFMFLVHNESVGSSFTSPRPFRVNAGAVHCYTMSPDGKTRYLSEIEAGSEVVVADRSGSTRRVTVGRSKIERRPMLLVKASAGGEEGGMIAQDAETIRLVRPGGGLVSVTHLKKGDIVMVHARPPAGRHFGTEVKDEFILEK